MLALRDLQTLFFLLSSLLQSQPDDCIHCLAALNEGFQPCCVCACACLHACVCTLKPTPVCTAAISTTGDLDVCFQSFSPQSFCAAVPAQNPFCVLFFFFLSLSFQNGSTSGSNEVATLCMEVRARWRWGKCFWAPRLLRKASLTCAGWIQTHPGLKVGIGARLGLGRPPAGSEGSRATQHDIDIIPWIFFFFIRPFPFLLATPEPPLGLDHVR